MQPAGVQLQLLFPAQTLSSESQLQQLLINNVSMVGFQEEAVAVGRLLVLEVTGCGAITFFPRSLHSRLTHSPVVCLRVHRVGLLTLRATASLPATWQSSRTSSRTRQLLTQLAVPEIHHGGRVHILAAGLGDPVHLQARGGHRGDRQ